MRPVRKTRMLLCGGTGFIGRNILEHFWKDPRYELHVSYHRRKPPKVAPGACARFFKADLTRPQDVSRAVKGMDVVVQAAATTSGARDIVAKPYYHVTDNAVMNSLLFRACHHAKVRQVIFFSCTVMYAEQVAAVRECDFNYSITDKYFGVGWTKVYLEKMCEFYARLGQTRYTAIRHSNVYGPHDKYDLRKSHVFGATLAKVMTAKNGKIVVWGDGSERRDLLYAADLVHFVDLALNGQTTPFELVNVGSGESISVAQLAAKIIARSGRTLRVEFDRSKPTIPFKLAVDVGRAKEVFGWSPQVSLDQGIGLSLEWYRRHLRPPGGR